MNISKNDRNIFEWFEQFGESKGIRHDRFDNLISWLAANHGLSVSDYRSFYYWCFDNRRTVEEVEADPRPSLEIWQESKSVPA
ncbi:hypothetical protein [Peribacillus frigoritolerans]|uniref:Uncharacterized protein n=1 Tax=Peribacillus frigoritolerans TaxID=450367 RepID=A0AAJ1VAF0_9BACI|nr:hypothetical protein [Peribacillus frigoritolerans]MDM5283122.1 hypothetical protein [Peribacillus frigoritolerans]